MSVSLNIASRLGRWVLRAALGFYWARIGVMLPFRREFERIMDGVSAPIIPVCLDGVWGSIFSYQSGRFFWKLPRRLPYPVTINFGSPMPANAAAFAVHTAIQELNTDAWPHRRASMKPLHRAFVDRARRCPFRFAMAEARVPHLSFAGVRTKTVFLARRLRASWAGQEMVGLFLPPSVAGALVNFAALLLGKVPVNLNYTLSETQLASAFEEKFGLRPVEGYGCTECSPVVTGNTHDFRAAGVRQAGSRRGSIGRPLPGVSLRIVDPETGAPRPVGQSGLLLVRGPNVMRGYSGLPAKTAEGLRDGWYVTGDIAVVDEDGFLQITDRLSRFSKMGGKMDLRQIRETALGLAAAQESQGEGGDRT